MGWSDGVRFLNHLPESIHKGPVRRLVERRDPLRLTKFNENGRLQPSRSDLFRISPVACWIIAVADSRLGTPLLQDGC